MLRALLLAILILPIVSYAADKRRDHILSIIEEEIGEVIRLSKQRDDKDPELLLRVAGLQMERARLIRESENEQFLAIPPEQRRGVDESRYYSKSTKSYEVANQYANAVVKRFPKYQDIGDVYYILAFNSRELKRYQESEKYLALANKSAKGGSETYFKAKLALAEAYYNKHEYKKAAPLYEEALAKIDNTWWTKDAFNMAWSHFRNKNYSRAIEIMKVIHQKSDDSKYINMKYFVERDLGLFYVDARRTDEAVEWYGKRNIDFSEHLIKIAQTLIPQGKFTQAEALLNQASLLQKKPENRINLLMLQLELFDKYEKIGPHLKVSEELTKLSEAKKLQQDQETRLIYQVSKKAAELQKSAASNLYKDVPKVRAQRAKRANSYFALLARLKPNAGAESLFFQGETLFAVGNHIDALKMYQSAYNAATREKNPKIQKQAMEGMLASLGSKSINAAQAEPFYVPVYESYLKTDPNSKRSRVIRQKLYKVHLDKKNLTGAEAVLRDYAATYPEDFKTQEAMLAGIMEEYRKKKDNSKIRSFVAEINDGTFKVSKKYADALRELMTKLQIDDAQNSLAKGDKSGALKDYIRIYNHPESTAPAKANAAYNLAALYYEMGDLPQSYAWSTTALKEMETDEVAKFADSFLAISTNLFLRQRFQQSADLGMRTVAKLCAKGQSAKNTAFKNSAFLWLAEGKLDKAEETLDLGVKCGIDATALNEVRLELAKEYQKQKRWESLDDVLVPVLKSNAQAPQTLPFLYQLRSTYQSIGDSAKFGEKSRQIQEVYAQAKSKNVDIPVEALDQMAFALVANLDAKKKSLDVPLQFPEQNFNQTVKNKLAILDSMTVDIQEIQKTGSGKGIVRGYRRLIDAYEAFATELQNFTPEGKGPEYVESFKKAMSSVWNPILQTAQKRRQEVAELIKKNHILSPDNFMLLSDGKKPTVLYRKRTEMVLMDRGGKR